MIVKIPSEYINVIKTTRFFSLKTFAKYAGSKNVIQHGANKATMPAINEASNES